MFEITAKTGQANVRKSEANSLFEICAPELEDGTPCRRAEVRAASASRLWRKGEK
jgi:hypothetical protein